MYTHMYKHLAVCKYAKAVGGSCLGAPWERQGQQIKHGSKHRNALDTMSACSIISKSRPFVKFQVRNNFGFLCGVCVVMRLGK